MAWTSVVPQLSSESSTDTACPGLQGNIHFVTEVLDVSIDFNIQKTSLYKKNKWSYTWQNPGFSCPVKGLQCSKGSVLVWAGSWMLVFKDMDDNFQSYEKILKATWVKPKARSWYFTQLQLWSIHSTWSKQLWMRFQLQAETVATQTLSWQSIGIQECWT